MKFFPSCRMAREPEDLQQWVAGPPQQSRPEVLQTILLPWPALEMSPMLLNSDLEVGTAKHLITVGALIGIGER